MRQFRKLFCLALSLTMTIVVFTAGVGAASSHGKDVSAHKSCQYCGMDREKFAHSRMLIEFEDGTTVATCSLHCVAVDLANNIDKAPKSIMVADYSTKQLIDAEKAYWVIGGSKQGVMTRNAKWAFAAKDAAEAFIKENGGRPASFDEAIKSAYEDMYSDTKMIRDKRKQMKMKREGHAKGSDMK
ncbi:nitrous oxide reductase accessory protein NosL [Geobacter sulfurreducens]|jgi:copper chaperone NosL|uniref:NosL family protein n=1 Tax=Geobacter sulfurreducens (strain ATCC 51573 / DSM 12127 / PCA) TaxID=243231 RepID=Q74F16_GEOSL|nr:nitrous oxide reductase accessory protein NosL [Geobacter sulfurreducens]AAR34123.1 NosL family protein [Geobacter sulfurreducens PCA]QVW36043.1 nitrous oxide reductase accessory protein NosL [Geobacter sulfurreducens]UAC04858.1 nitrous oxide reductase accessory protein NosL [Geobacter sulfurreducens]HBB69563.1 NosL family protein [Geobacter sulfurreducens]HCD96868.1 NosL family protein [Geobacter sulfurreducens]